MVVCEKCNEEMAIMETELCNPPNVYYICPNCKHTIMLHYQDPDAKGAMSVGDARFVEQIFKETLEHISKNGDIHGR